MNGEVPVWVGGSKKWVTGLNKKTTCDDVIKALLEADKRTAAAGGNDVVNYVVVERWRKVERPLEPKTKLLKTWNSWGEEQANVKLSLKVIHRHRSGTSTDHGTTKTAGYRRKPQAKVKWRQVVGAKTTTIHPKKLASLQQQSSRKCYSESMEQLMKVIIAQGETIQEQLKRLETKEDQIESYEQRLHANRVQTIGANYLLDSYLASRPHHPQQDQEAETVEDEIKIRELQRCIVYYERLLRLSERLEREESTLQWLTVELDSEMQGQRSTQGEEEVRAKVERMTTINNRNLIELEENEMQLAKLGVWLEDKHGFIRHLECDLREAEDEQRQLENVIRNICNAQEEQETVVDNVNTKEKETHGDTDSNSDTGLSSLHSSSDDVILDTLV
ncbi:hypothetical protein CHUAL_012846 [Chamberlinius hualienensis]